MPLRIFKETSIRVPRKRLTLLFDAIRKSEATRFRSFDVNLVFTTDRRMKKLNSQYRGKPASTDVLSFTVDDGRLDMAFLGEIYISVPTARRQAASYGASLAEENLRLTCHGLLHLLGYDHLNPADERRMKATEERYLAQAHH